MNLSYDKNIWERISRISLLGNIIDQLDTRLPPKQALDLLKLIVRHREELKSLLDVNFEYGEESLHGRETKNILTL